MHSVLDWMESPSGMICIATRRVDENIWVRINEYIPPHTRQFPSGGPSARQVHVYRARHTHFTVRWTTTTPCLWASCGLGEGQEEPRVLDLPDGRPALRGEGSECQGTTTRRPAYSGVLPPRLGTPGHHRSWHHHVEEYRQAWDQGREKWPDPEPIMWRRSRSSLPTPITTVIPVPEAPTPEAEEQLLRETGRHVQKATSKTTRLS